MRWLAFVVAISACQQSIPSPTAVAPTGPPPLQAAALRCARDADVAAWIDRTTTAVVPLAVIGTPAQKLRERLGARIERDEPEGAQSTDPRLWVNENALLGELVWEDRGVGAGPDPRAPRTVITAFTKRGTIVGLVVSAPVDRVTGDAIRDRITALFGVNPGMDEDEGMMFWNANPPVRLDLEGKRVAEIRPTDRFQLEVGTRRATYIR